MSNKAVSWALEQWLPPSRKIVLVAIADCVNHRAQHEGSFPSLTELAELACQSKSSVRRHITALEELGLLTKQFCHTDDGRQTSNFYRLNMDKTVAMGADEADFDDGEGVNLEPRGGCQNDTLGGSTGDTLGGSSCDTPMKGKRNRKSNHPLAPKGESERDAHANADEERPAMGGEDDEAFSQFFEAWPDSAGESRPKAWAAWKGLRDGERNVAFEKIGDFVEFWLKKKGRKHLIAPDTYLRERRFMNLPKAASSAAPAGVEVKPFSRDMYALFLRWFRDDDVSMRTKLLADLVRGASFWVRNASAPTAAEISALVFTPITSGQVAGWAAAFKSRGLRLPIPSRVDGVWLPQMPPPEAGRREFSPEMIEGMKRLGVKIGDRT